MTRRAFLRMASLSVVVLALCPSWLFASEDKPRWKRGASPFPTGQAERYRFVSGIEPAPEFFSLPDRRHDRVPYEDDAAPVNQPAWFTAIRSRPMTAEQLAGGWPHESVGQLVWCFVGPDTRSFDCGDDYLFCNGRILAVADYPELAAVLQVHPKGIE